MASPSGLRRSPFADHAGPIRHEPVEGGWRLNFVASEVHSNGRGAVHGGMLATLLDEVMGQVLEEAAGVPSSTVELGVTYIAGVPVDENVSAEAKILRLGGSLAFVEGTVFNAEGEPAARGRAVFKLLR
jgi:uncharacterized protein (TIGR00369 family)